MHNVQATKPLQLKSLIDWPHFFHAWQMKGAAVQSREAEQLKQDALRMLHDMDSDGTRVLSKCLVLEAYGKDEDIILKTAEKDLILPCLRQQHPITEISPYNLCLADYLAPNEGFHPIGNRIGIFATAVHAPRLNHVTDDYEHLLMQTLADRMAEAEAERLHRKVLQTCFGVATKEGEPLQGCRPAIGYPSLPDLSLNFLIQPILKFEELGIRLTDSGMMIPHAAVSGLIFAHPQAKYFSIARISEEQFLNYAGRRNLPPETLRRFLSNLLL